jgi:uncharacterized Zn finger protein (UPF0148 family)
MKKITNDDFIKRCIAKFGDLYSYDKTKYIDKRKNVIITCKEHGDVEVSPKRFLNVSNIGCPICGKNYAKTFRQGGKEEFVKKAKEKFGDIYSFPSNYKNSKSGILIHCNICGNEFYKRPNDFLMSKNGGCNHFREKKPEMITFKEFEKKANEVHDFKFKYVPFDGEKDVRKKTTVICPIHGNFETIIKNHLNGSGCKMDSELKTTEEILNEKNYFLKESEKIYGNEFYINIDEFSGMNKPITMKCNKCGYSFKRIPAVHIKSHVDCRLCKIRKKAQERIKTTESFINECKEIYGDEYSYDKTVYTKSNEPVIIKHNKCGRYFSIEANSFLQGHGCPYHFVNKSKGELDLVEYIRELLPENEILTNDRTVLDGNELDIYIPDLKIAFEYDGLFLHNSKIKEKDYHLIKTTKSFEKGINLYHIFEDEWLKKNKLCKMFIHNLFFNEKKVIFDTDKKISQIKIEKATEFHNENSLEDITLFDMCYALFYQNEIIETIEAIREVNNGFRINIVRNLTNPYYGYEKDLIAALISENDAEFLEYRQDKRLNHETWMKELGFEKISEIEPTPYFVEKDKRVPEKGEFDGRVLEIYNCGYDIYKLKINGKNR